MTTTNQFREPCNCRCAGECNHNSFAELAALNATVDAFARAMKEKLLRSWLKGKGGWDNPDWKEFIKVSLHEHISKGDMVDVANLAMMLWNFEQPNI